MSLVPDETVETLVRHFADHLHSWGGAPLMSVFDRPKTVALKWQRDGVVTEWNPTFAYAALEIGVGVDVCWPYRPQETFRQSARRQPSRQGQILGSISIRERPPEVDDRAVPGHWEGDLLVGGHNTQIATLVERTSRYAVLVKVPRKDAVTVRKALARQIRRLPDELTSSLTWDRGTELAQHVQLSVDADLDIYSCDPQSPWQRGTNENTNRLLRQYFPKGVRLDGWSQAHLNKNSPRAEHPTAEDAWIQDSTRGPYRSVALTG